ncbi:MAG TPA: nucleotidyltransferase domain-containing protein [Gaiellaceae bacterium]|nr:nucleotidyltransferase domain-containing protein [Gaiellaceae bacterium]
MLEALLEEARHDENVIGVVLFGSRGRGVFVDERSDWDVYVVVREVRGDRPFRHGDRVETIELTLEELGGAAGDRYHLAWLEPHLDKTGEVAAAMRAAVLVDPATAAQPLDAYVNSYYRSAKNARHDLALGSLLDALESIPHYLEFVFALHGRLRPYNKWLEWELREHPLPVEIDLARLERIGRTGALEDQQALFRETEALARAHGHAATIDGWEPDVAWLRG